MKINVEVEVSELDLNYPCWCCKQFFCNGPLNKCIPFDHIFKEDFKDIQPHQKCLDARKKEV